MRRFAVAALLAVCVAAGAARAADDAPIVDVAFTVKSPFQAVEKLDALVSTITENTRNAVPQGFLAMMAGMYSPFPPEAWNGEGEMRFVIPRDAKPFVVITVESFDAFLDGLRKAGGDVEEEEAAGNGREASVSMQGTGTLIAVEAGPGKVAVGEAAPIMRLVLAAGALPSSGADADVGVAINMAALGEEIDIPRAKGRLAADRPALLGKLVEVGVTPKVADGVLSLLPTYLELAGDEVALWKTLFIDLDFLDEHAKIAVSLEAGDGSFLAEMGAGLAKLDDVSDPIAPKVGEYPLSLSIGRRPAEFIPDFNERLVARVGEFAKAVFPDLGDRPAEAFGTLAGLSSGNSVMLGYGVGGAGEMCNMAYLRMDDAAKAHAASKAGAAVLGEMLAGVFEPDTPYALRLETETATVGGAEVAVHSLAVKDPEALSELLDEIDAETPGMKNALRDLIDFSLVTGTVGDVLVTVSGRVDTDDYEDAVAQLEGVEDPILAWESTVAGIATGVPHQGALVVMDADDMFATIMEQVLQSMGEAYFSGGENLYLTAFEQIKDDMITTAETVVCGYGAVQGRPAVTVAIPHAAVNAMIRNYEIYNDKRLEVMNAPDVPEEGGEEEDVELDEPAAAS